MKSHFDDFVSVLKSLEKFDVEYVLIGGVAVILYGLERTTADMDVVVKTTTENVEKLKKALYDLFEDMDIEEITLEELGEYAVVR